MMFKYLLYFIFIIIVLNSLGCNKSNDSSELNDKNPDSINILACPAGRLDENSLSKIINNRNNRILFINVWATWCVPCVEEFPDIVKLYNNYKNTNVQFLSLSVDLESDKDSLVIPFLKKQKANFPVFIADGKSSEDIINLLNSKWSGAVPVSIIYDKTGKQQKFLLGKQNYETLKSSIDSVISL